MGIWERFGHKSENPLKAKNGTHVIQGKAVLAGFPHIFSLTCRHMSPFLPKRKSASTSLYSIIILQDSLHPEEHLARHMRSLMAASRPNSNSLSSCFLPARIGSASNPDFKLASISCSTTELFSINKLIFFRLRPK
jgi:hypothetical protein